MALAAPARVLPGIRFETVSPPLDEILPRMDLAVFIGFAASGPLHTPVVVEDVAQFSAVFGGDVALAWDQARSEQVFAYLGPAVRAFFRNGGRRCWVVRVAGAARSNVFAIPGLLRLAPGGLTPGFAQARSEGSWSDTLRVGATLLSRPLVAAAVSLARPTLDLALQTPGDVGPGDLLRLTLRETGHVVLCVVESVADATTGSPPSRSVQVSGGFTTWFSVGPPAGAVATGARASVFTDSASLPADVVAAGASVDAGASPPTSVAVLDATWPQPGATGVAVVDLGMPLADAPPPGSFVRIDAGAAQFWLIVQDVAASGAAGGSESIRVQGSGLWWLGAPPDPLPVFGPSDTVERLTFELAAWQGPTAAFRASDLGFAPGHRRFWASLPTDRQRYQPTDPSGVQPAPLSWTSSDLNLPLSGCGPADAVYAPLGMPAFAGLDQALGPLGTPASAQERDGLATFGSHMFLDADLADTGVTALIAEADFLRYQSPTPRFLTGIHAALGITEATLIAVPDLAHRGWDRSPHQPPPPVQASAPLPRPEWWHFRGCEDAQSIPRVAQPEWGNFFDRGTRVIDAPVLVAGEVDRGGTFALSWSSVDGAAYVVEESTQSDFQAAFAVYQGADTRVTLYGRGQDDYFFRVRAVVGGASSDWSNGVAVRVDARRDWLLRQAADYSPDTLLAVQRALLRVCAARGDLFAVLALPEHYRDRPARSHARLLGAPGGSTTVKIDVQQGFSDAPTSSYGGLYFPWLVGADDSADRAMRRTPPDGAVCGLLAQFALTHGAWISPANSALQGVVGLQAPVPRERWADLLAAQVNLLHQDPRGFVALSSETLSDDPALQPINVRRLLMLVRRLAQKWGTAYVFEPDDDSLQRSVQSGFEAMLDLLFTRGAFAGATEREAFQVVTSSPSGAAVPGPDEGRLVVELRVAPSLPMTFLTVRLVQTGDGTLVATGR